jgi:uncharacterized protein
MRNPYDVIGRIGLLLAIVGGINWLLVGLFQWNAVQWIFTQSGTQTVDSLGERIVYIVVGAGAVLAVPMLAATLARSRSRDLGMEDRGGSEELAMAGAGLSEDDTAFYSGAPKNDRELANRPQRVRTVERVVVTEPMPEPSATTEESFGHRTVEAADGSVDEGQETHRAA